jgi:acetyltransferase-like isoleucine patch superfamily enzyme
MKAFFKHIRRWFDFKKRGVTVWKYCNISLDASIGNNVSIGAYTEIGPNVHIGDNVRIGAKCFIPEGVFIGADTFIGPGCTFSNDRFPPASSKDMWEVSSVQPYASLGAGVCVLPGVIIGHRALVGMGSVVTRDVPPDEVWAGVPAMELRKDEVSR